MISKFLPKSFCENESICLIAGKGSYPIILHQNLQKICKNVCLIAFEEETSQKLIDKFEDDRKIVLNIGQIGKFLKSLKNFSAKYAILAGQITPKKLFHGLNLDAKAISILLKLKKRNAESIFGMIVKEIEQIGIQILDARSFMDQYLADFGHMTDNFHSLKDEWISHAIKTAKNLATLEIGQSVIVSQGTVLAVEDFGGTDDLINRVGKFQAKNCIFAKASNENHDFRFDVPVFGPNTIELLKNNGIIHACLEANKVLILEKEKVLDFANHNKISLFGFSANL